MPFLSAPKPFPGWGVALGFGAQELTSLQAEVKHYRQVDQANSARIQGLTEKVEKLQTEIQVRERAAYDKGYQEGRASVATAFSPSPYLGIPGIPGIPAAGFANLLAGLQQSAPIIVHSGAVTPVGNKRVQSAEENNRYAQLRLAKKQAKAK